MLSKEFKKALANNVNGSRIVSNNEKRELSTIADEVVTIADYEKLSAINDDGERSEFYAFTVEEHAGAYYNAGSALNKILAECDANNEDFRGERVKVGRKIRLTGGRTFTPVTIVE